MPPRKMAISAPLPGSHRQFGYQAVPGATNELPTSSTWMKNSAGGAHGVPRDTILRLIDEYLVGYNTSSNHWDKLAALGQPYFLTDAWLKQAQATPNALMNTRKPAVEALFLAVVDRLCFRFGCSVNVLPQHIEECWGRILTTHGAHADQQQTPVGGVPPSQVIVKAVPYSWKDTSGTAQKVPLQTTGDKLPYQRGTGWGLHNRYQANLENIESRGGVIH